MLADETNGDLFEIVPEMPYTDDDLNYNNDDCRANTEQHDDSARPAIASADDIRDWMESLDL